MVNLWMKFQPSFPLVNRSRRGANSVKKIGGPWNVQAPTKLVEGIWKEEEESKRLQKNF
jgi:hypothetical protein